MTGGWAATNTLREAASVLYGNGDPRFRLESSHTLEHHESVLALMEAALDAADRVTAHTQQPIDLNYVAVLKDEFEILAAALRAVREGTQA